MEKSLKSFLLLAATTWLASFAISNIGLVSESEAQQSGETAQSNVNVQANGYIPGSEELGADEIRIIALGTGTPSLGGEQASGCFLIELGNGEKFLFDVGTGCTPNIVALGYDSGDIDKVFITHLHSDHFGDLGALFVAGNINGRQTPLRVWGPSGATPELGTRAAVGHVEQSYLWDKVSRGGRIPVTGMEMEVTEFDYSKPQIVYDNDGVVIHSWPAIHTIDGPVSFSLTWRGQKVVYSGDTSPNKWFLEYGQDADVLIYECFGNIVRNLTLGWLRAKDAWEVGTKVHTTPQAAGKVFSLLEPRMAVCYHFNRSTNPDQVDQVRLTYDGPLVMSDDMMVFNVNRDENLEVRMVARDEETGKVLRQDPGLESARIRFPADPELFVEASPWITEQALPLPEVEQLILSLLDPDVRENLLKAVPSLRTEP